MKTIPQALSLQLSYSPHFHNRIPHHRSIVHAETRTHSFHNQTIIHFNNDFSHITINNRKTASDQVSAIPNDIVLQISFFFNTFPLFQCGHINANLCPKNNMKRKKNEQQHEMKYGPVVGAMRWWKRGVWRDDGRELETSSNSFWWHKYSLNLWRGREVTVCCFFCGEDSSDLWWMVEVGQG